MSSDDPTADDNRGSGPPVPRAPDSGAFRVDVDSAEERALVCPDCEAHMPEDAAFCPGCGRNMHRPPRAEGSVGIFPENIAGALSYLTLIPAIVFLLREPYKRNGFVRFHSAQCLLLWAAAGLTFVAVRLLTMFLFMLPVLGPLLVFVIVTAAVLAAVLTWLVLVVKALQGEMFKLPILGRFAEEYSAV
ncbi:MAG TPA: hypothetical protein VMG31_08685 [Verrucomicrobiae bacterium]|nr:hypothetical protein [Verrucomicrobiae bacterium]